VSSYTAWGSLCRSRSPFQRAARGLGLWRFSGHAALPVRLQPIVPQQLSVRHKRNPAAAILPASMPVPELSGLCRRQSAQGRKGPQLAPRPLTRLLGCIWINMIERAANRHEWRLASSAFAISTATEGTGWDNGGAVRFLLSDQPRYITG
jgi:hypothetical protein